MFFLQAFALAAVIVASAGTPVEAEQTTLRSRSCPGLDHALRIELQRRSEGTSAEPGPYTEAALRIMAFRDEAARREALRHYELECNEAAGDRDV
jgi:hypothetical protein